jgi:hypothetical protein
MFRKLIGIVIRPVIATAMMAAVSSAAGAAPMQIVWDDFSRAVPVCWNECVRVEYALCYSLVCDDYGCRDYEYPCSYCAEYGIECTSARIRLPDGDLIDVTIEHNAINSNEIEFRLRAGPGVNAWKQITISDGADTWRVWTYEEWWTRYYFCNWPQTETPNCDTIGHWAGPTIERGQIVFSKTRNLFFHEDVYVLRNLGQRLSPGDRVTFRWVED